MEDNAEQIIGLCIFASIAIGVLVCLAIHIIKEEWF